MTESAPSRQMMHDEMERARHEFHALPEHASSADLARATNGTRWTNRELLFHLLFGYLVTRNLLLLLRARTATLRRRRMREEVVPGPERGRWRISLGLVVAGTVPVRHGAPVQPPRGRSRV